MCTNERMCTDRDLPSVRATALNYRLRFCVMSMGLLTAHGDPQMLPLLTVMLRSREQQKPQSPGTLIPPPPPPASLFSGSPLAGASSRLAALILERRAGLRDCVSPRLPGCSHGLGGPRTLRGSGGAPLEVCSPRRRAFMGAPVLHVHAPFSRAPLISAHARLASAPGLNVDSHCCPFPRSLSHSHPSSLSLPPFALLPLLLLPLAAWFRLSPLGLQHPQEQNKQGKLQLLLPVSDYCSLIVRPSVRVDQSRVFAEDSTR